MPSLFVNYSGKGSGPIQNGTSVNVKLMAMVKGRFPEVDGVTGSHLGEEGEVNGDDIGYAGIAAGGLAVGHEDDGLTIAGDLNGAQRNPCRDDIGHPFLMLNRLAGEAIAYAVTLGGDSVLRRQEAAQTGHLKIMGLGTGDDPDGLFMFVLGNEAFWEFFKMGFSFGVISGQLSDVGEGI